MSDNFDEHARTFNRHGGIRGLADEIDALRAENERLRQERDDAIDAEKIALRAIGEENERLRAALERVNYLLETDNAVQMAWSKDIRAVLGPPPAQDT